MTLFLKLLIAASIVFFDLTTAATLWLCAAVRFWNGFGVEGSIMIIAAVAWMRGFGLQGRIELYDEVRKMLEKETKKPKGRQHNG